MPYTVAAENAAITGVKDAGAHISLHSADPGSTGASEITGGTYTRELTVWGSVAASAVTGSSVTLDVPSGNTITHWGLHSAGTGGTFLYGGELPAPESFGSNGTYSVTPTLSAGD